MKKVININFHGRIIPIEESAYDILKKYVESLRKFFENEEGRDEIINDIEGRIAELFEETLKKGNTCIADNNVQEIIASMGTLEDFESEETNIKTSTTTDESKTNKSQESNTYTNTKTENYKRLYRNENDKVLGGVCSGVANYLNVDPVIIRIAFVILSFGFGFGFLTYLILWVAVPSTSSKIIGGVRKRLFRDVEDKVIAGVCSGLGQYFNVSVWIPRVLFLIPFFSIVFNYGRWHFLHFNDFVRISFSPGSAFVYIILWLVLPEAKTTSEKLEMKGEKVDLNNIKNTIQSDLENFGNKAKKWGEDFGQKAEKFGEEISAKSKEIGTTVSDRAKEFSYDVAATTQKNSKGLGDAILIIAKIFGWFILGCVLFSIVCALFSVGIVSTGLMTAKNYVLHSGWQSFFAWGTLIFFVWTPVVGIVTFVIRRIAKLKGKSSLLRYSIISLWTLGWVCFICLIASISRDFKYVNAMPEQNIILTNPSVNRLEIKATSFAKFYSTSNWLQLEPYAFFDEDTAFVRNVRVRIVKSTTDSFKVSMLRVSNGHTKLQAEDLASKINYTIQQVDSTLLLDKGIAINSNDKFRNQYIIVTVAVPIGKKFVVKSNAGRAWNVHERIGFGPDLEDWNSNGFWGEGTNIIKWRNNVEYIMTINGAKVVKRNFYNDDNESDEEYDDYRYRENSKPQNTNADTTRYKYTPQPQQKTDTNKKTTSTVKRSYDDRVNTLLAQRFEI